MRTTSIGDANWSKGWQKARWVALGQERQRDGWPTDIKWLFIGFKHSLCVWHLAMSIYITDGHTFIVKIGRWPPCNQVKDKWWLSDDCSDFFISCSDQLKVVAATNGSPQGWRCSTLNLWTTNGSHRTSAKVTWWEASCLQNTVVWLWLITVTLKQIGEGLQILIV